MLDATFACPDLTTFCRLDGLGLVVTGQRLEPDRAVLACQVVDVGPGRPVVPPLRLRGSGPGHASFGGWRMSRSGGVRRRWR